MILFRLREDDVHKLLYKFKLLNDDLLNEKIMHFADFEKSVFEDDFLKELSLNQSTLGINFKSMKQKIAGNDALHDIISILFDTLIDILTKNSQSESIKILKLINNIVGHISQSRQSFHDLDNSENIINSSIQRLMDQLTTDDLAQRAILEMKEYQQQNSVKDKQIETLKDSLAINNGDLLKRNSELQDIIMEKDAEVNQRESFFTRE
jgi:hypothetical protein